MVHNAIELAQRSGVELATGDFIVEPLTLANYRNLSMNNDGRPDTDRVTFLVKTRLGADTDAATALQRIDRFVTAVPAAGRAGNPADRRVDAVGGSARSISRSDPRACRYRRPRDGRPFRARLCG